MWPAARSCLLAVSLAGFAHGRELLEERAPLSRPQQQQQQQQQGQRLQGDGGSRRLLLQAAGSGDLTQAQLQYLASKDAGGGAAASPQGPSAAGPGAATTIIATAEYTGELPDAKQGGKNLNVQKAIINGGGTSRRSFAQVNQDAPVITDNATGQKIRPVLTSALQQQAAQGSQQATSAAKQGLTNPQSFAGGTSITGTQSYEGDIINGDTFGVYQGVRISTPVFGSGYNLCVDNYFGSFPVVGVVIPNAAAWLIPELGEAAQRLRTALDLPTHLNTGMKLQPTSDGFLISFPTIQPSQVPEFGFRYGIQIGQAFGLDFGIGIQRDICSVSFALV